MKKDDYRGSMVGREHDLSHALSFLSELNESDSPGLVCYWAPGGVGKTRLVKEINRRMADFEFFFIEADQAPGTDPFSEFLIRYFGIDANGSMVNRRTAFDSGFDSFLVRIQLVNRRTSQHLIQQLIEAKPYIEYVSRLEPGTGSILPQLEPLQLSFKIRDSIASLFRGISLLHPTVLVLENIQWFSQENFATVEVLLESSADIIGAVIATGRPDETGSPPHFPEGGIRYRREVIFLEGLSRSSIPPFVCQVTGAKPDRLLADFLWNRAGGVPLFLEQAIDYLTETRLTDNREGTLSLSFPPEEVEGSARDFFLGRIKRMGEQIVDLFAAAAILGRTFHRELLSGVVGRESLGTDLEQAVSSGIFFIEGDILSFAHVLFREWAVDLTSEEHLRILHLRAAEILSERTGTELSASLLEEVADHYRFGNHRANAAKYIQMAAERYAESFENTTAIRLYGRLASMVGEPTRTQVELSLAEVYRNSGLLNQGIELLTGTLRRITDVPEVDEILEATVIMRLGANLGSAGKLKKAEKLLSRSLMVFQDQQDLYCQAIAVRQLGMITSATGRMDEAISLVERSIALARDCEDSRLLCAALYWAAITYRQTGQYQLMKECTEEQVEVARESGLMKSIISGYDNLMRLHIYNMEYEKATEIHRKLRSAAELTANWAALSTATSKMGIIHLRKGENDLAIQCFKNCVTLSEKTGNIRAKCAALGNIAGGYIAMNQPDRALNYATELIDTSTGIGFRSGLMSGYARMGYIFCMKGDYPSALDCIHTQIEHATALSDSRNLSDAWATIARIQMNLSEDENALKSVDLALTNSRKASDMQLCGSQLGLRGKLYYLCGRFDDACRDLREAMEINRDKKGRERMMYISNLYFNAARVCGDQDGEADLNEIRQMVETAPDHPSKAEALYVCWQLTGEEKLRESCRSLLENLRSLSSEPLYDRWFSKVSAERQGAPDRGPKSY